MLCFRVSYEVAVKGLTGAGLSREARPGKGPLLSSDVTAMACLSGGGCPSSHHLLTEARKPHRHLQQNQTSQLCHLIMEMASHRLCRVLWVRSESWVWPTLRTEAQTRTRIPGGGILGAHLSSVHCTKQQEVVCTCGGVMAPSASSSEVRNTPAGTDQIVSGCPGVQLFASPQSEQLRKAGSGP